MAKKTPEVNATSTADIAFLLLVFFLVTTTMNVDSGMFRRLPPYQPDDVEPPKMAQRNILQILVNKDNQLLVGGTPMEISQLKDKTLEFILNPMNSTNLPDVQRKNIDLLGEVNVSRGIISLQNHIGTTYATYIAVQDQLAMAFNEARNMRAVSKFGKKYTELNDEQQKAIRDWVPMQISEAEPRNVKTR